jgi:hypothetical protein
VQASFVVRIPLTPKYTYARDLRAANDLPCALYLTINGTVVECCVEAEVPVIVIV